MLVFYPPSTEKSVKSRFPPLNTTRPFGREGRKGVDRKTVFFIYLFITLFLFGYEISLMSEFHFPVLMLPSKTPRPVAVPFRLLVPAL